MLKCEALENLAVHVAANQPMPSEGDKFYPPAIIVSNDKKGTPWYVEWIDKDVTHTQVYHDKGLAKAVASALIQMSSINQVRVFEPS